MLETQELPSVAHGICTGMHVKRIDHVSKRGYVCWFGRLGEKGIISTDRSECLKYQTLPPETRYS